MSSSNNESDDNHNEDIPPNQRLDNITKINSQTTTSFKGKRFSSSSRHSNSSTKKSKNNNNDDITTEHVINDPDSYNSIEEKKNIMTNVETSIQNYFPSMNQNGLTWNNLISIIRHAKDAYTQLQHISHYKDQFISATQKIEALQTRVGDLEQALDASKKEQNMKIYLSRMISELLEDLMGCISGYIWFIKEGKEEISSTGLYNPKVGLE